MSESSSPPDDRSGESPAIQHGDAEGRRQLWGALLGILCLVLTVTGLTKFWPQSSSPEAAEPSASAELSENDQAAQGLGTAKSSMAGEPSSLQDLSEATSGSTQRQTTAALDRDGEQDLKSRRFSRLTDLVQEFCGVSPTRINVEQDAYTVEMPIGTSERPCLDAVALEFDRDFPRAPQLLFDLHAAAIERDIPILQVSMMHTGSLPYIQLRDGQTLFVGAVVDGWTLSVIDDEGAEFRLGDRTFRLAVNKAGDAP